ncbi:MAG: hypothetical protein Kow0042_06870 [Calditrichia bacterium]
MKKTIAMILMIIVSVNLLPAQETEEEFREKVPLLLQALNYNETLKDKINKECVIAILFNPQSERSLVEKEWVAKYIGDNKKIKVYGKKVKVQEIELKAATDLEKKIILHKINAFWLTSDVGIYMKHIKESAKYNRVITIATDPNLVTTSQVALSSQKTPEGYRLVVNLTEAKNINIDLNNDLLGSAMVIR